MALYPQQPPRDPHNLGHSTKHQYLSQHFKLCKTRTKLKKTPTFSIYIYICIDRQIDSFVYNNKKTK